MLEKINQIFNQKKYIPIIVVGAVILILACSLFIAIKTGVVRTYRIFSDNGFAQNDITLLMDLDKVDNAYGTFTFSKSDEIISVRSLESAQGHNILEGVFPSNLQEIVIDYEYAALHSYKIGSSLKIADTDFKVVGFFTAENSGYNALAYKAAFGNKQYDNLIIGIKGDTPVVKVIEPIKQKLINNRIQEIYKEKNKEILQLEDEYNALDAGAKDAIAEAEKILANADSELKEKYAELESYMQELEKARKELADSKKELDAGKNELDKTEKKLNSAKAELDNAKKEYKNARKQACEELGISDSQLDDYLDDLKQYTDGSGHFTDLDDYVEAYDALFIYGESARTVALEQADRLDNINKLTKQKNKHAESHETGVEVCEYCDSLQTQIDEETATSESTYQEFEDLSWAIYLLFPEYTLENTTSSMKELAGLILDAGETLSEMTTEAIDTVELMIVARDEIPKAEKEYAEGEREFNNARDEYNKAKAKYDAAEEEFKKQEKALQEALAEWNKNNDVYNSERDKLDEQSKDVNNELEQLSKDKLVLESEKDKVSIAWSISGIIDARDANYAILKALLIAFAVIDCGLAILFFYIKKYR